MSSDNDNDEITKGGFRLVKFDSIKEYFKTLWNHRRFLKIELIVFFYFMPAYCLEVAISNFPLEKACRVNFMYSEIVCAAMLDKADNGIECEGFNFENTTKELLLPSSLDWNITANSEGFNYTVCKAETVVQRLNTDVTGKRSTAASIIPLIVVLFAGSWADRYNKRKLFMIIPIIGEVITAACLLISAIFFNLLPMEFGAYLEAIGPSLFGGQTLSYMAFYSYMTMTTPEQDRVFRFGILTTFNFLLSIVGRPISGPFFTLCGYIGSFIILLISETIAILCVVFLIEEIKPGSKETQTPDEPLSDHDQGVDNLGYEATATVMNEPNDTPSKNEGLEMATRNLEMTKGMMVESAEKETTKPVRRNICVEMFDPTLMKECLALPLIKRKNNNRMLLILLICAYFLIIAAATGEGAYFRNYTLKKFGWNNADNSNFLTFNSIVGLIGTLIGTTLLSKVLGFHDSIVGMISVFSDAISRLFYAFASKTVFVYIAGLISLFTNLSAIGIRAIGPSIVQEEELSKLFAIFGICEPITQFIFPYLYGLVYNRTLNFFPGAIFLLCEILYIPTIIVFIACYVIHRRNVTKEKMTTKKTDELPGLESKTQGQSLRDNEITPL